MKENVIGINDELLKKLILEIYEYRDKVSKLLEDAEILVDSTNSFYNSNDGVNFRNKFKTFSANFPTFLENIRSYGEDLEYVLSTFKKNDIKSVDIFRKEM